MGEHTRIAVRVSVLTVVINGVLAAFKLIVGLAADSSALLSDAVHSASDVVTTVIVIVGVRLASKQADRSHPYGHERFECVAAMLLSFMLALTGLGVGACGARAAFSADNAFAPSASALAAAAVSVVVKEWMYRYTIRAARKINSDALAADAWHHRSDSLSSVGSFVGVLGARAGMPFLDGLAGVVISLFILKAAFDIFKDCTDKMIDRSCDEQTLTAMQNVILSCCGVVSLKSLRSRLFGSRVYVDADITADGALTLYEAHSIAKCVHDSIESEFPQVKHCMVHVEPSEAEK